MVLPFVKTDWNRYEAVLLVDTFERVVSGEISRKVAVKLLSYRLRNRMFMDGINVSDKYRNENGIAMQLSVIEFYVTKGEKGLKSSNKLFNEVVTMSKEDRAAYEALLKKATALYPEPSEEQLEGKDCYEDEDIKNKSEDFLIKEILCKNFSKGFRVESVIELKRFRNCYKEYVGKDYEKSDEDLARVLKGCGLIFDNKLYVPEFILSKDIKIELETFIKNIFNTGRKYVYYETIFKRFNDEFLESIIVDEKMLQAYMSYYYADKWVFFKKYITSDRNVNVDIDDEIIEFVKIQGRVVTEDATVASMNHIPEDDVRKIFNKYPSVLVANGGNKRFHIDLFVVTQPELDIVCEIIDKAIDKYDFLGSDELFNDIRNKVPTIVINNNVLSEYGIRKALICKLEGKYSFNNAIISAIGHNISAKDALLSYAKIHKYYSLAEVDTLAKSLGTVLNYHLETLLEYSIRINQDRFVPKTEVSFDIEAIDRALGLLCTEQQPFLPLRKVVDFATFPNIQYPWSQRLLESFLIMSSRRFMLLCGDSLNKNYVCGAIVRRNMKDLNDETSKMKPFDIVLSIAISQENINLEKEVVLNYLANEGYIAQRRYAEIDMIISKARVLRDISNN